MTKVTSPTQSFVFSLLVGLPSYCTLALLGSFKSKQLIIGLGYPLKAQLIATGFIHFSFNDTNFLGTKIAYIFLPQGGNE